MRVESVAWVSERKDVLSGLFFMLTLWCYARYAEQPSAGRYLLTAAAYALGLTAKPMLVTLPFILLLLDIWPLGRSNLFLDGVRPAGPEQPGRFRSLGRLAVEKLPLLVLSGVSCAVTLAAQRQSMQSLERIDLPWRAANAIAAYVDYMGNMFYPVDLAVLYPLPTSRPPVWDTAAAGGVLLVISGAALALRRRCPYFLVGWFSYLGTLVPVIGLVQVGGQKMADRYTYLPQIGLNVAIAWAAADLAGAWPRLRRGVAAAGALALAVLMACAGSRAQHCAQQRGLCGGTPWTAPRPIGPPTTTLASTWSTGGESTKAFPISARPSKSSRTLRTPT